jgi:hypothetical protein
MDRATILFNYSIISTHPGRRTAIFFHAAHQVLLLSRPLPSCASKSMPAWSYLAQQGGRGEAQTYPWPLPEGMYRPET